MQELLTVILLEISSITLNSVNGLLLVNGAQKSEQKIEQMSV